MAFLAVKYGEFRLAGQIPIVGELVLIVYVLTQAATDGGGTVPTGYGTTGSNGEIIAIFAQGNVVDKDFSGSFAVTTGVITLVANGTAGPTDGWLFVLVKKS